MSFRSWIANLKSACNNGRQGRRTRASRDGGQHRLPTSRFRPLLEALEDRWMPSTLTVLNNLDSGPGSLRAEIAAAHNNDTIVFAPSLAGQTITLTSAELLLSTAVTIQGPGASQLTVSGNNHQFRVFEVNASQPVVLTGLTISNGKGGILNHTALRISSCTISGNTYSGLFNVGTMTVSGCTMAGNTAYDGGGIYSRGTLTASNSTIAGNRSIFGGGGLFAVGNSTVTLTNCTISNNGIINGNTIDAGGGGVYAALGSTVTLTNCTLANNLAIGGSGANGGGLHVHYGATANLTNCTVSGNSAGNGYGIFVDPRFTPGVLFLSNTIVAGNVNPTSDTVGPDISGYVSGADHNLVGDATGSTGIVNGVNGNIVGGNGNPVINADLGPLQNNGGPTQTMALLAGSPPIGHADNAFAPATDQRGFTRLDEPGEATDIGAFEL